MGKKTIGIIGGMGPLATADLFEKIVGHTIAACDQEHLDGGADPLPELAKSAGRLEKFGADVLIIPCNTAHYYYDGIAAAVSVPVLHMVRLTARALVERGVKKAGLLATDGTVRTGIYQKSFAGSGVELLTPDEAGQRAVMEMIYQGVKAGDMAFDAQPARQAMERLLAAGAEVLILGCTELPLAVKLYGIALPAVDPTLELALEAIRFAGGETV